MKYDDSNKILCPSCLYPNDANGKYCFKCNTPIGQNSTTDPVQAAIHQGRGIVDGVEKPNKLIIVLGIWLLFVPFVIFYSYLVFGGISDMFNLRVFDFIKVVAIVGFSILPVFFGYLVFKTTLNYVKSKRVQKTIKSNSKNNNHE